LERIAADERETTALDLNMMLYVVLFLILVALFAFSLLRRRPGEQGGQNGPSGSGQEDAAPNPEGRGEGE
jgi:hypothetical protein